MEDAFGMKPIPTRGGGSIPIVALFEMVLGLKTNLFGFGLEGVDYDADVDPEVQIPDVIASDIAAASRRP